MPADRGQKYFVILCFALSALCYSRAIAQTPPPHHKKQNPSVESHTGLNVPPAWARSLDETSALMAHPDFIPARQAQRAKFLEYYVRGTTADEWSPDVWGFFVALNSCDQSIQIFNSRTDEFEKGAQADKIENAEKKSFINRLGIEQPEIELTLRAKLDPWDNSSNSFSVTHFYDDVAIGSTYNSDNTGLRFHIDSDGAVAFTYKENLIIGCKQPNGKYAIQLAFPDATSRIHGSVAVVSPIGFWFDLPNFTLAADQTEGKRILSESPDRVIDIHVFLQLEGDNRVDTSNHVFNVVGSYSQRSFQLDYRRGRVVKVTATEPNGTPLTLAVSTAPARPSGPQGPQGPCWGVAKMLGECK
jgi:hypothetical protein